MTLRVALEVPAVDLLASLRWHRVGFTDPGVFTDGARYAVAFRMPEGPVTLVLTPTSRTEVTAELEGEGSEAVVPHLSSICGAHDDPEGLIPLTASMPRLQSLVRRERLVRMARVPWRYEIAVGTVLQQRVDFPSAAEAYAGLLRRHGERAPGPLGLWLLPRPEKLGALPSYAFRELGVDGQRERALRALTEAHDALVSAEGEAVRATLTAIPGFGPWTVESIAAWALGDADALPTGDYWLPHLVSHALLGKPRSTDEEMTSLLSPFRPHRFRVLKVLQASGKGAPRFGPRRPR